MQLHRAVYQDCVSVVPATTRFEDGRSVGLFAASVGLSQQDSHGRIGLHPASPVSGINLCRPQFQLLVLILLILILCCCLGACADLSRYSGTTLRDWEENSTRAPPRPGENLIIHPNFIRESDSCNGKKLPFMLIEKNELMPTVTTSGKEFKQRLMYVFCPNSKKLRPISGTLYRKIYFQGRLVFEDVSKPYQLKPGKWSVDAFITVPPEVKPGSYAVVVTFKAKNISLEKSASLIIEEPEYPAQIAQSSK